MTLRRCLYSVRNCGEIVVTRILSSSLSSVPRTISPVLPLLERRLFVRDPFLHSEPHLLEDQLPRLLTGQEALDHALDPDDPIPERVDDVGDLLHSEVGKKSSEELGLHLPLGALVPHDDPPLAVGEPLSDEERVDELQRPDELLPLPLYGTGGCVEYLLFVPLLQSAPAT